jgi:Subtilase family
MAAAAVAGAAARIIAARRHLTAQQVRALLEEGARDLPPAGIDSASGVGALDLAAALAAPDPPRGDPEPNDDPALAADTRPLLGEGGPSRRTARGRTGSWSDPRDGHLVWLAAGQRLTARLAGPRTADLDLVLWRPGTPGGRRGRAFARTWLASASLGPSSAESISHVASSDGIYTLEVQGIRSGEVQGVRSAARYALTAERG